MGRQVFGEAVGVLLRELAAHTGQPVLVDNGMCALRLSVPAELGGALRRAILRATAVELRRAAEVVSDSFARLDAHELEAAAVLRVVRAVTSALRVEALPARSLQERAFLLGVVPMVPPVSR